MNIAITVTAYNRPEMLRQTLEHLRIARDFLMTTEVAPDDLPVITVYVDGPERPTQDVVMAFKEPNVTLVGSSKRKGLHRAVIEAKEDTFSVPIDGAFIFTDDLLCAECYLAQQLRLMKWLEVNGHNRVGLVGSNYWCRHTLEDKKDCLMEVEEIDLSPGAYFISRSCWQSIEEDYLDFLHSFRMDVDELCADSNAILEWMKDMWHGWPDHMKPGPDYPYQPSCNDPFFYERYRDGMVATGQDGGFRLCFTVHGWHYLSTDVNRLLMPVNQGQHSSPNWFKRHGLDKVTLDQFEEDRELRVFSV